MEDGKVMTGRGVSAGIDMALTLAARIAGEDVAKAIQLGIEYDPDAAVRRRLAGQGGPGARGAGAPLKLSARHGARASSRPMRADGPSVGAGCRK